jgi:clan AA aspartic protease
MGFVKVKVEIRSAEDPSRRTQVELVADTESIYTIVPHDILKQLDVKPRGRRKFRLADERVIERDVGIAEVEIKGEVAHPTVIFGEKDDAAVLGVTALEELGLQINPVTGELKPMELLLL